MAQIGWTREQLLKTLALYCQIPFGKMSHRNPDVVAVAKEIGRTPSAVAYKLGNFASMDPELAKRGIKGLANSSEADRRIWAEFYGKWALLASQIKVVVSTQVPVAASPVSAMSPGSGLGLESLGPTEVVMTVKQRRGQRFFRAAVMAGHDGKCCITGIAHPEMLRASHIVPWKDDAKLRLNPRNGLCLNALHDAAFDRGLFTLTDACEVRYAKKLKKGLPREVWDGMFAKHEGQAVQMPERFRPEAAYLAFHRERVFCGQSSEPRRLVCVCGKQEIAKGPKFQRAKEGEGALFVSASQTGMQEGGVWAAGTRR